MRANLIVIGEDPIKIIESYLKFSLDMNTIDGYNETSSIPLLKKLIIEDEDNYEEKTQYIHSSKKKEIDIDEIKCWGILSRNGLISNDVSEILEDDGETWERYIERFFNKLEDNDIVSSFSVHL